MSNKLAVFKDEQVSLDPSAFKERKILYRQFYCRLLYQDPFCKGQLCPRRGSQELPLEKPAGRWEARPARRRVSRPSPLSLASLEERL